MWFYQLCQPQPRRPTQLYPSQLLPLQQFHPPQALHPAQFYPLEALHPAPVNSMDQHQNKKRRIEAPLPKQLKGRAQAQHKSNHHVGNRLNLRPAAVRPVGAPLEAGQYGNFLLPPKWLHQATQQLHGEIQNYLPLPSRPECDVAALPPTSKPPERPTNRKDDEFKQKAAQWFDWVGREIERKTVYAVKENLGEGGFGRAVLLEDRQGQGNEQVVKIFVRESEAAEEIRALKNEIGKHPNIINMIPTDATASSLLGVSLLFLEYCDLGSLYDYRESIARSRQPLEEDVVWHVILSLAKALAYLHSGDTKFSHGPRPGPQNSAIVHRDIKPENILLCTTIGQPGNLMVKLGDFGLAKRLIKGLDGTWQDSYSNAGTHQWQSSEQVKHPHHAGLPQDVWSMGATLHYLALGEPPIDMTQANNKLEHNSSNWKASIPRRVTFISWKPSRRTGLGNQRAYIGDGHQPWSHKYSMRLNKWMKKMLHEDARRRITAQAVVTGMSKVRR